MYLSRVVSIVFLSFSLSLTSTCMASSHSRSMQQWYMHGVDLSLERACMHNSGIRAVVLRLKWAFTSFSLFLGALFHVSHSLIKKNAAFKRANSGRGEEGLHQVKREVETNHGIARAESFFQEASQSGIQNGGMILLASLHLRAAESFSIAPTRSHPFTLKLRSFWKSHFLLLLLHYFHKLFHPKAFQSNF